MTALLTDNLPLLAGAPNGIKKLRELILELAVRGKLVPQDPSDEPASELLKRIAEEKARLVAEGKIKKQKPLVAIVEEENPFELPVGWQWSSLAQVAFVNPRNAAVDSIEVSFVPMTFIGTRFDDQHAQEPRRWKEVKQGFTHFAEGDIGVAKITPCFENSKACVFSNLVNGLGAGTTELHIVRPVNGTLDPRYVLAYLKSPQFLLVGETKMTGTAGQKRLPKDFVEANPFPLPPLAEQHRIVAKVDELMALCDRLEAQQADAGSAHAQLVQALLDSLTQASDATDFATNWQRLAEHFNTLFATTSSINALKQTLLQLAVMGKLVPQDQNDEPASKLLERISNTRLNHRDKKQKSIADISEVEKPFELPGNWAWVTLPAVGELARGKSRHRPRNDPSLYTEGNVPLIQTGDVARANGVVKTYSALYNAKGVEQSRLWPTGTMCITIAANIGDSAVLGFDACFPDSVVGFTPDFPELDVRYFEFFLRTAKSHLEDFAPSTAQKNINLEILGLLCVPLPPANEMHRIIAKVDQLTVLCDHLNSYLNQARQLNEQLASALVERALTDDRQRVLIVPDRLIGRTLLAAEITHQLHGQRTFGQRKLQKVIYLVEHVAKLAAIQGEYLRDAAGPHDRQLMNKVEGEMQNHQWYERIERETVGHAYRPLSQAGQHRQAYSSVWSAAERATIEQVIELMRDWDTDRCEMTVTLYAAWNDFILEGRPVSDEAIVEEVMHSWNDTKLRFGKTEWLAVLGEMKKHKILMPCGFGKRTIGGMLSLPGFE
ncbi:restriction endonuclease subunit S [Pseudomonas sp. TH05]|uniref:restriction endonuclease subunit S n=1 Tax=unclassified Pseudomonas TaxID=196821 RepID=UPI001911BD95|nr:MULTISPECIES: restriction endonuclease subunit S [unclassified Pseudomonas]MBK5538954.1 restriction endonuclease subunit S [Pseudomonas sp. TH07]MBK5560067.1 restriction endonuclease subunit S [Pseudomonas sp. TH05]